MLMLSKNEDANSFSKPKSDGCHKLARAGGAEENPFRQQILENSLKTLCAINKFLKLNYPAEFILELAPLDSGKSIVKLLSYLADLTAADNVLLAEIRELTDR